MKIDKFNDKGFCIGDIVAWNKKASGDWIGKKCEIIDVIPLRHGSIKVVVKFLEIPDDTSRDRNVGDEFETRLKYLERVSDED